MCPFLVSPSFVPLAVDIMDVDSAAVRGGTGSARRRRERRLRQHWRHEQLTLQMLLATYQHHAAPWGQTTARSGEWGSELNHTASIRRTPTPQAAGTQHFALDVDEVPAVGFSRPDRLSEVRPQERDQRHTVEQIIAAPMIDVPVPLMEEQLLVDVFAPHDIQVPEQVIEVPKILIDELSARTPVREPQLAEQVVEVPTIISFSSLQRNVEQLVNIPVPRGGVRRLQGFPPEQGSTALPCEQIVDIPVPLGESLHGFLPGQGSASSFQFPAGAADDAFQGVFQTFPHRKKKCDTTSALWVGTASALETASL